MGTIVSKFRRFRGSSISLRLVEHGGFIIRCCLSPCLDWLRNGVNRFLAYIFSHSRHLHIQIAWQQKIRQKNVQIDTLKRDLQQATDKVLALQIQVPPSPHKETESFATSQPSVKSA